MSGMTIMRRGNTTVFPYTMIDCFWSTVDMPGKGIDYCGVNLIPPSSARRFIAALEPIEEFIPLAELLARAEAEGKFVIHFGI